MANEIELKLALGRAGPDALRGHPELASCDHETRQLGNTYFDTPDGDLEKARSALRLRRDGAQLLQTVKTRGQGGGGLSTRGEWEWPVTGPGLDIDGLAEIPPMAALGDDLLQRLVPRFSTNFRREIWRVEDAAGEIEVALDIGEIQAGDRQVPIRELELELKRGEPDALYHLALRLTNHVPLRPSDTSKAARGGALLQGYWSLPEGSSASSGFHRATVALDALSDTGDPAWREAARLAFQQLADLSDPIGDDQGHAHWLANALGHSDWLDSDFGAHALQLSSLIRSDTPLG